MTEDIWAPVGTHGSHICTGSHLGATGHRLASLIQLCLCAQGCLLISTSAASRPFLSGPASLGSFHDIDEKENQLWSHHCPVAKG